MSQYTVLITKVIDQNHMVQVEGAFSMDEPTMDEIISAIAFIIEEGKTNE